MTSRPNLAATPVATPPIAATLTAALPIWLVAAVLAGLGFVLPLLVADRFGALGIARGDDVAYTLSAFRFFDTGTINGSGWAAMNLVGQVIAAAPVVAVTGHEIAWLHVETAAVGFIGLLAVYDLSRQLLSPGRALFVAVLVAINPLWVQLAPTFMTDVPAFSLAMVSLALGARAVESGRHRGGLLVASFAAGLVGFTIREFAIVAPIVVALVAMVFAGRRRERLVLLAGVGVFVSLVAVFLAWRRGLPGFVTQDFGLPTSSTVAKTARRLAQSLVLLGVMISPALFLAGPVRLVRAAWSRARVTTTVVVGGVALTALIESGVGDHAGGFVTPDHYNSNQWTLASGYRALLPSELGTFLKLVGVIAVAVTLCAVIPSIVDGITAVRNRELRVRPSPVFVMVALGAISFATLYVASSLAGVSFFSRYLLPIVPLLAILLLAARDVEPHSPRFRAWTAIVSLVVLGAVGAAAAAANASLDGAKWAVAEHAARVIGPKHLIDGGFEWNNVRLGEVRYSLAYPPPGTCVRLGFESTPPSGDSVVSSEKIWTVGNDLWVVARQVRACPITS